MPGGRPPDDPMMELPQAMSFKPAFDVAGRAIGTGQPAFLIAEIGRNHNGDIELGKRTITAAARAGADAVKFQSLRASELLVRDLPKVSHVAETSGADKTIYQMTEEVEMSRAMHEELQAHARSEGILFFSTPEDPGMVTLLDDIDVPLFKMASLDIVFLDLVEAVAATGRPVILSTGMATLGEIEGALAILRDKGVDRVILLHCTSNYPPRIEDVNLRAMDTLAQAFQVPVGYSDHTMGTHVSLAAVARGACVIERHFTLDRDLPGPDHRISLMPEEFALMAGQIRDIEVALGSPVKGPVAAEAEMRRLHRRRLVANRDLPAGHRLERADIGVKCSADGLEPSELAALIGRPLTTALTADQPLTRATVDWSAA